MIRAPLRSATTGLMLWLAVSVFCGAAQAQQGEPAMRNGVTLAARSGFDPDGLPAVLQQLRTAAPDNPLFSLSLRTHPAPQLRLDQLEQAMGNRLDAYAGKPAVPLSQRLAARRRSLWVNATRG